MPNRSGFTLVETLLYVAIASVVLISLTQFGWNIIGASAKNNTHQDVVSNARFAMDQINLAIRNASDLDATNSNFGTDLATTSGAKLTLRGTAPNDPIVFDISNGLLRQQIGTNIPVTLTPDDVVIQSLIFTNYSSPDEKTKNIAYELTVTARNASARQEYQATTHIRGGAEIRSNTF